MFDCFRRRRLDRGLSVVEADDPDTSDGVRAGSEIIARADEGDFGFTTVGLLSLVCGGETGDSSSRRISWPVSRRTPPEGGDLVFMVEVPDSFLEDGRFFSRRDG